MIEKAKIELALILPDGSGCEACLEKLSHRVQSYKGIDVVHTDHHSDSPRVCVHYDPNLLSLDYVRAVAAEEGAHLEWRYRHDTLPIEGLDCADCARTLEAGVARLDGVLWASVNFAAATLTVGYDTERIARPAILSRIRAFGYEVQTQVPPQEMVFDVEGLDCADCAVHLEEAVRRTPGVGG